MRKQARLAAITFRCSTDKAAIERRGEDPLGGSTDKAAITL